jgi:hypothetical protein
MEMPASWPWGIPPSIETTPFFLGMASNGDLSELILTMPKNLASRGRLDGILAVLCDGLAPA